MMKSFNCRETEKIFRGERSKKFPTDIQRRAFQKLAMLDASENVDDFNKPKLLYSEIVQEPRFYFDANGSFYNEATSFLMTGEHLEYLQKMLHSKLLAFAFKHYYAGGGLGESGFRYKKAFLEKLPIIKPTTETEKNITKSSETEVDNIVTKLYELSDSEIQFISSSDK